MDHFLLFNSHRNQFKWTGSVEQFESYMIQRLNVSKEDIQSKCNNGTCMVWMTPNVTFNFYVKTKTLQVQGKAVDPIREIIFQSLGHCHQDATADETVFGNEDDNLSTDPAPSATISDGIRECTPQDDLVSVLNENADTFDSESPPKHLPFGCQKKLEQLSEEIELLKQENRHYANQLQAIHDFSETKPYDRFRTSKENNCDVRRA